MEIFSPPTLHHSTTPLLHYSTTPLLHHSTTPPLHYSTTPTLQHFTHWLPLPYFWREAHTGQYRLLSANNEPRWREFCSPNVPSKSMGEPIKFESDHCTCPFVEAQCKKPSKKNCGEDWAGLWVDQHNMQRNSSNPFCMYLILSCFDRNVFIIHDHFRIYILLIVLFVFL